MGERRLRHRNRPRPRKTTPFPGAGLPQRLEGSRFVNWQFYQMAAGGSRERSRAVFCPSRLTGAADTPDP
jgi:hypothetical protein